MIKTPAVILSSRSGDHGRKNLVYFTRQLGKLYVIAAGARKSSNHFGAGTEPLCQAEIMVHWRPGRPYHLLTGMSLIDPYWHLNDNIIALSLASQAAEITDRLTEPEHPIPELYDLICFILGSLDRIHPPMQRFLWYFVIHALTLLGWEPVLDRCAHCGAAVITGDAVAAGFSQRLVAAGFSLRKQSHTAPVLYFSPSDGGILCPACARNLHRGYTGARTVFPLSKQAFRYLLKLSTTRPSEIINIAIPKSVGKELSTALSGYLEWFLPVRLKSSQFLNRYQSNRIQVS